MHIIEANPNTPEAHQLLEELSDCLQKITGSSGKNSFQASDVCGPRSLFVIAYSNDGQPGIPRRSNFRPA